MPKKPRRPKKPRTVSRGHGATTGGAAGTDLKVTTPIFGDAKPSPGPTTFKKAMLDKVHYNGLNLKMLYPVPAPRDGANVAASQLVLTLDQVMADGQKTTKEIARAGKIVFHSTGDTGPVNGPRNIDAVVSKMTADFADADPTVEPRFLYHLGDVVYNFGEDDYYYNQFYEPYRDYPAPILAIAGNHDTMTWDPKSNPSMSGFLRNFCNKPWVRLREAGGLARTAMIQPAVYFTFDAPLVRIIGLFSNGSEDPGVISSEGDRKSPVSDMQLNFLTAQLAAAAKQNYSGALIIAVHHPPYCWTSTHSGSPRMLQDIDACCKQAGFYPHAVLSGHAHNYQRFTRNDGGRQVPYVVCGCGGYNSGPLKRGATPPRTPVQFGNVTFDRFFVNNYGYLRVIVTSEVLRIEYHDTSLGNDTLSPADAVNVDIASRQLTTTLP